MNDRENRRISLGNGRARREARDDAAAVVAAERLPFPRCDHDGEEHVGRRAVQLRAPIRKREMLRHHSDNGVWESVEPDYSADDTRVASKFSLPETMADDNHRASRLIVLARKQRA